MIDISHFANRRITVWDTDDRDDWGRQVNPASITVMARVQPYTVNIRGLDGHTVASNYTVYFRAPRPIAPQCTIEVSGDSRKLPSASVCNYHDDLDRYTHTRVIC